jgi:hypothetical protein
MPTNEPSKYPPNYVVMSVADIEVKTQFNHEGLHATPEQSLKYAIEMDNDHWVPIGNEWVLTKEGMKHLIGQCKAILFITFEEKDLSETGAF